MKVKKRKLTLICVLHYLKLTYRSLLFILAAVMYVVGRIRGTGEFFWRTEKGILVAWCDLAGVRCGNGLQVLSVKA